MRIGVLAKSVGCHVETVRYYEKEGLLPPALKAPNGYGLYSEIHLKVLRLIRHAKGLGFSQPQIRELVRLATNKDNPCDNVYRLTEAQLTIIDAKLRELQHMRNALKRLSAACRKNEDGDCPVLEYLVSSD